MKAWYGNLNPRERMIVAVGGVVVVIVGIYSLLIDPLASGLQQRRERLVVQQEMLDWIQIKAEEIRRLKAKKRSNRTSRKAPYLLLDEAIKRARMPAPANLEPRGKNGTEAQFDAVSFDALIKMLANLQSRAGLTVSDLSVTRQDGELVRATVLLSRNDS